MDTQENIRFVEDAIEKLLEDSPNPELDLRNVFSPRLEKTRNYRKAETENPRPNHESKNNRHIHYKEYRLKDKHYCYIKKITLPEYIEDDYIPKPVFKKSSGWLTW